MGAVVGIDLGTTNTVVACVRNGRVHVLADEKGNRLLPSVVSFHPSGDVLVGYAAKTRRLVDAKNTVASIKRLIGRPWDSDEIRLARSRFAFELREGPGQGSLVVCRGEAYTLPEISAFVLKRVRQIAEAALGETVDKAVITVPAHFNELQRASTKVAGRVAGLEVLRILNEPTAAALAYGFGSTKNERVAVYDYGGGTFDCSLLELSGNLYEVLATAGDTFLGGDDIDSAIAEQMCGAFLQQHRYDPRVDPQAFERLRAAAETIKIDLSANMQAQLELAEVAYGVGGAPLGMTFGMTQADLDAIAEPFVQRTLQVTQDSLNIAQLSPSAFDCVVLVGGSTRMPIVRRRVEAFFGSPPMDRVNPDEVVAIGAAIQAAALAEGARRSIPPPPIPGAPRPPTEPPRAGASTLNDPDDVPTELFQRTIAAQPERKLPSLAPQRTTQPLPAPPVKRGTLRPPPTAMTPPHGVVPLQAVRAVMDQVAQQQAEQEAHEPPASKRDDSMTKANTLPGAQHVDPSLTKGTLPSMKAFPPPKVTSAPTPFPSFANVGPLPTEDISRIVPDAMSISRQSPRAAGMPGLQPGIMPVYPDRRADPGPDRGPGATTLTAHPREDAFVLPVGDPRAQPNWQPRVAPVLVDVTPRALVVEVVGGFSDTVIPRNATIPCEHTRVFATGRDMQTTVHIRIAQGEAPRFAQNTYLGELELSGLRPAARGDVTLSVTFELDADGSLQVQAVDASTGRQARATMRLIAVAQTEEEIEEMIERSRSVSVTGG